MFGVMSFVLGSRDETAGCQLCVAAVNDDGTLTLRLRMPDGGSGGIARQISGGSKRAVCFWA